VFTWLRRGLAGHRAPSTRVCPKCNGLLSGRRTRHRSARIGKRPAWMKLFDAGTGQKHQMAVRLPALWGKSAQWVIAQLPERTPTSFHDDEGGTNLILGPRRYGREIGFAWDLWVKALAATGHKRVVVQKELWGHMHSARRGVRAPKQIPKKAQGFKKPLRCGVHGGGHPARRSGGISGAARGADRRGALASAATRLLPAQARQARRGRTARWCSVWI